MNRFPEKLQQQLHNRQTNDTFRLLGKPDNLIDFSSNDYLGFAKSETIFKNTHQFLKDLKITQNGATGSRLLSGNHELYTTLETQLSRFHNAEAALVFNSGYTANLGFFSIVPRRGDIIFYDELIHASIRDGIALSNAKAYKFKHNDFDDLADKCLTERNRNLPESEIYIVTESVFSMDGDTPDLKTLTELCKTQNYHLVIDEAHALGIFGEHGSGLVQELGIEKDVFARIVTFGKALGCHGAVILGSQLLKEYLVNFSRPFIYTTGSSPHTLATLFIAYQELKHLNTTKKKSVLQKNNVHFKSELNRLKLKHRFIDSNSTIHCCIISGNSTVKNISKTLQDKGFNVKPILSPTVPKNQERLRFCLHSYNTKNEITTVLEHLRVLIDKL